MVAGTSINEFRSWINDAQAEDLEKINPALFSRIGSLDQRQQERVIQDVQRDPQAKRVLDKMNTFSQKAYLRGPVKRSAHFAYL